MPQVTRFMWKYDRNRIRGISQIGWAVLSCLVQCLLGFGLRHLAIWFFELPLVIHYGVSHFFLYCFYVVAWALVIAGCLQLLAVMLIEVSRLWRQR